MAPKPTIFDVARRVGVSGKTVSRVVNGDPNVSEKVHKAVTQAIAELGYRQNFAARSLRSKRSFMIGVLSPPTDLAFYHSSYAHLSAACRRRGYHLLNEQVDVQYGDGVHEVRNLLATVDLAGLVLMPGIAQDAAIVDLLRQSGKPWVALGTGARPADGDAVDADEAGGAVQAADHLWSLGHRRFCILAMPPGAGLPRGAAFEDRLLELGADPALMARFDIDLSVPSLEIGRQAALHAIEAVCRPTAMFALSDATAAGAVSTFLVKGLGVPDDMSVIGFDDSEIARAIFPALTTLRQPLGEMADAAIDLLVDRGEEAGPQARYCPVELIVRQSTSSPRR